MLDIFRKNNSKPIFLDDSFGVVRYSDILDLAKTLFPYYSGKKVVLVNIDNDVVGISGYLAAILSGHVPLLSDSKLSREQINKIIASYSPEYAWVKSTSVPNFPLWRTEFSRGGYSLLSCSVGRSEVNVHDALAILLSTSGSTGSQKYVRISSDNLLSNSASIAAYLDLHQRDLAITTLPPSYSYGLSIIHSHIYVGGSIAVTKKTFFDRAFWDFLNASEVTSMSGVPYHYEILEKLRFRGMRFPSLRTLTQAGGPMSEGLTRLYAEYCRENGMRFFSMYGQTEASPRISYVPSENALAKAGAIGIPIPGGTLELQTQAGAVLSGSFVTGELVYRGPNVCLGYAEGRADLALGDVNCGVLHTGDLAERDDEGYYRIVGRQKRFIKLFGNRVNLQELESNLSSQASVACSGKDNLLEVYLVQGKAVEAMEIKQKLMANLRVGAQNIMIYEVDELPRNESGKVLYANLNPESGRRLA